MEPATPDDVEGARRRMQDAIPGALPNAMVTKWVVLAEVIDPDGSRAVWRLTDDESMVWDVIGLLEYALTVERGGITPHDG